MKRTKQRRSKRRSKRARSKNRRKVRFSNMVQTICPTESSKTNDTSSYDGNVASAEDNGGPIRTRVNNSLENDISKHGTECQGLWGRLVRLFQTCQLFQLSGMIAPLLVPPSLEMHANKGG